VVDPGGGYSQAEGPLQFIPSTWATWGRDGNGDGVKDPNNIYDAALAAADYLCSTSTALQADAGLSAAYMSYNHSADYVTEVLAYARSYEAAEVAGLIPPLSPVPLYSLASGSSPPGPGGAQPSGSGGATAAGASSGA
jgi:membrane-bound lytic murein transglycosylase B